MTMFKRVNKFTTAVLCAVQIGSTAFALAPAAEAMGYEHQRRHELRQRFREIRRNRREYHRARWAYHHEINRYPRLMPTFGAPAGLGVRLVY